MADELIDDPAAIEAADPGGMLRVVASAAAQVREAGALCTEAEVDQLSREDLPRAVIVLGLGVSALAGEALVATAGPASPVPVLPHAGPGLPGWVGAADLVVAVSTSGTTPETLSALEEAVRRGCRLLVVGPAASPLQDLAERGRALFVPVTGGRAPRASLLALVTPLLVAGNALGLVDCSPEEVEATAVLLEQLAARNRPTADTVLNPAKTLALSLQGTLPIVWGTSPVTGAAAHRFAAQLALNARTPAVWGVLPDAALSQVGALDGPFAGGPRDIFADPEDEDGGRTRMHLVMLRDTEEAPTAARLALGTRDLARSRGVDVSALQAEGSSPFQRLASLVALADWTTTYLALLEGHDPTPVPAWEELRTAMQR